MQVNNSQQIYKQLCSLFEELKDSSERIKIDAAFLTAVNKTLESCQPEEKAETKNISILLSDLRGFTAMAEKYSPLTVIELLNRYLSKMSLIIDQHGGTIDKFMGDSILVLFDAPGDSLDNIKPALTCALKMQIAMDEINQISQSLGMANLYMGIGINSGEVVAGTLGSDVYREYTVIGDEVNLTSRVEAQSLRGQILLSENSYKLSKDLIEVGDINDVHVKGKRIPVKMYELLAVTKPNRIEAPCREIRKSPRVEVTIQLDYQKLCGKQVLPEVYHGHIIDISYGGLFMNSEHQLKVFSEIKITVSLSLMGAGTSDIYARVLNCEKIQDKFESHLEFTAIDDAARKAIKTYVNRLIQSF